MKFCATLLLLCLITFCSSTTDVSDLPQNSKSLSDLINAYRVRQGLTAIPISPALTRVAMAHVQDLERQRDRDDSKCNLHSWSAGGPWSACCYKNDGSESACMWSKPREIAAYKGDGFEIAAAAFSTQRRDAMSPWIAIDRWAHSDGHRMVILNDDKWKDLHWKAMGAAISDHYASAWFGTESN